MDMESLIKRIKVTPDCIIYPPSGIPTIQPEHTLPEDVLTFYQLCGGIALYEMSEYSLHIVPPENFQLANPIILVGLTEEQFRATRNEISWSWYLIGQGESNEYVTIDLHPNRLGRCYYSFWDRHAMKGYSPVIATSFTDLLIRMLDNRGQEWYWEQADFESLGDAYD